MDRKRKRRILSSLLGIASLAIIGTAYHYNLTPFNHPEWYRTEWERAKDCTRNNSNAEEPYFLKTRGRSKFFCGSLGKQCQSGVYVTLGFVVLTEQAVNNKKTVRHEMLHALGLNHEQFIFNRCLAD